MQGKSVTISILKIGKLSYQEAEGLVQGQTTGHLLFWLSL